MKFLGDVKPKKIYTDGSGEFKAALEDLQYPHDVSTPHRPRPTVLQSVLIVVSSKGQAVFSSKQDYLCRFGKMLSLPSVLCITSSTRSMEKPFMNTVSAYKFKGLIIPFGAAVSYKPHGEDADALHKFGPRTRTGIFIGYYLHHGGKWSGDYLLYDLEKLTKATDFHHVHLVRVKEMIKPKSIEFPLANGSHSLLLGDINNKRFHDVIKEEEEQEHENDDTQEVKTPAGESSESSEVKTPNDDDIETPSYEPDYWIVVGNSVTRVHRTPRKALYVPHPDDGCPVDLKYVDVMRHTTTDLDTVGEKDIEDVWVPHGNVIEGINAERSLSDTWTGRTSFELLMPNPGDNHYWIHGRKTRRQANSSKPDHLWPETWNTMSKPQRRREIERGKEMQKEYALVREHRDIGKYVPADDIDNYNAHIGAAKRDYAPPVPSPAMPVVELRQEQLHREKIDIMTDAYGLVARPVPHSEIRRIPAAQLAVQAEWDKLTQRGAWDLLSVEEYSVVAERSRKEGIRYHFGHLAQLCHEKHSELCAEKRKYKGRVVFRGDAVKNEDGLAAVFNEQGSSACLISGIKVLDAVARLPGNDGQERDGQQAYIQAKLGGNPTYVHLPRDQWPAEWKDKYVKPVVRLKLALYGHPLAGLYWEKHAAEAIVRCGFTAVPDWECMYYHKELGLMLGIYVDDFKLVGKTSSIAQGWKLLEKEIKFDDASPLSEFLGCKQVEAPAALDGLQIARQIVAIDGVPNKEDGMIDYTTAQSQEMKIPVPDQSISRTTEYRNTRSYHYTMTGFSEQCVERYCELANVDPASLKETWTPHLDESKIHP